MPPKRSKEMAGREHLNLLDRPETRFPGGLVFICLGLIPGKVPNRPAGGVDEVDGRE